MRRREFIKIVAIAGTGWPHAVRAQQPTKMYRLGYLAPVRIPHFIEALQTGLRELGYVEGRNLQVDYRFGGSQLDTLDVPAAELVALGPNAIVTVATAAAIAAKRATATIPIVMAIVGDPLRAGLVANLAHPGGNITGTTMYESELSGKRVDVLKEAMLGISRIAVLGNAINPSNQYWWEEMQPAARALGIEQQLFMVGEPGALATVFAAMQRNGVDAVIVLADPMLISAQRQIIELAAEHRLPAMYGQREYVEDGGLISYGPNVVEVIRHSATFVDKILKGAKPADLPIEQPTKFELIINLKTARSLGLTIPPLLLARADKVIE